MIKVLIEPENKVVETQQIILTEKSYPSDNLKISLKNGKLMFRVHIDDLGNTFKCDVSEFIDSLKQIGA